MLGEGRSARPASARRTASRAAGVKLCCMGNPLVVKVTRSVAIYRRHVAWLVSAALPLVAAADGAGGPGLRAGRPRRRPGAGRAPHRKPGAALRRRRRSERRTYAAGLAAYVYGLPGDAAPHRRDVSAQHPRRDSQAGRRDDGLDRRPQPGHALLRGLDRPVGGPLVLETPPTDGRHAVVQLLDGSPTRRPTSATASAARLASAWPSCRPASPAPCPPACGASGCRRRPRGCSAARSSTPGRRTSPSRGALLTRYRLTPLASDRRSAHRAAHPRRLPGGPAPGAPADRAGLLRRAWRRPGQGPSARARARPARLRGGGDRSGSAPGRAATGPAKASEAAAADGPRLVDRLVAETQAASRRSGGGWTTAPGNIARFGRDFPTRAFVTEIGLGANTPRRCIPIRASTAVAGACTAATCTSCASPGGRRRPCAPSGH